jgi:ribose transport system permease protein
MIGNDVATVVADTGPERGSPVSGPKRSPITAWDARDFVARYGSLAFLAVMVVFLAVKFPSFRTFENVNSILASGTFLALMAFGMTVVMSAFEFDLSIGYVATLAALITAGIARDTQSTYYAMAIGLAIACACGLINGLIVTRLGIPSFMATLAMSTVWYGVIFFYTQGTYIATGLPLDFNTVGTGGVFGVRYSILIVIVTLIAGWTLLERTAVGRRMYATGGNPLAARLSGVNLGRIRLLGFILAGLGAGLGGILLASNLDAASPQLAVGYLLDAFTAVFLGASVVRGRPHLIGTAVGVVLIGVLDNGMTLLNYDLTTVSIVRGIVLLAAIALSQLRRQTV